MFGFLANIFNFLLYIPLFNFLILLYNYIPGHDFGIAIILLTIIIRVVLYPLSLKAVASQKVLQKVQPLIQEAQKKYKDDKERQAKEVLEIYKKEKINPFSGFFLALIQLPILIALYWVFWNGINPKEVVALYPFVTNPGPINTLFLGMIDLAKPNLVLAVIAGIAQFFQTKMLLPKKDPAVSAGEKKQDFSAAMQSQMTYFFPVVTIIILLSLPSALGLYWTISGAFSIIQQYFVLKKK